MQKKIVLLAIIVIIAISSVGCPPQSRDITVTASLVAMSTSTTSVTESSGGLIWSSSVQNEVYYYFYLRNADESIQLHRALATHENVFIIEDTEVHGAEDAFVIVTINSFKSELDISEYPDFTESWDFKRLEIHLPPGTIIPVLDASIA